MLSLVAATSLCFVRAGWAADPCAIPNFGSPTNISVHFPSAVVVGDFNNDAKLDLAAADHFSSDGIAVLLGNGSGGFSAPTTFDGGRNPTSIAAGDLNGDGKLDLVTGNESNIEGELSIFLGNGTGGFTLQPPIFVVFGENRTTSVAIGDVNADGRADLVLTSATFSAVLILLSDGTGGFPVRRSMSSGGFSPTYLLMRDINGDGKTDLVVANRLTGQSSGNVAVMLGDGAGNFSTPVTSAVGIRPSSIAAGDFNDDSKLDLAVANNGSSNLSVLLGDGAGNFGAATNYDASGSFPGSVVQGDFNNDSKIDLALLNGEAGTVIFQGDGAGGFQAVANFPASGSLSNANGSALAVADFNADGRLDLVAANEDLQIISVLLNTCGAASATQVQLNGNSFFGYETDWTTSGGDGSARITVTRTGGIRDVATVDYTTSNGTATAPQDYTSAAGTFNFAPGETFKTITIPLINDSIREATESFTLTLSNVTGAASLGIPNAASVFIGDDDPVPTVVVSDATVTEADSGSTNAVFRVSLSHASDFAIVVSYTTADGAASAAADYQATSGTVTFNPGELSKDIPVFVNGDTLAEIHETFFLNLFNPTNATLADAQGLGNIIDDDSSCPGPSFSIATPILVGSGPFSLITADFNNDGRADLASANLFSNSVSVLLGGAGGLGSPSTIAVGAGPRSIAAGDFNSDGKLDMITANFPSSGDSSGISILPGDGAGGFAPAINTNPVVGSVAIAVGDLNLDSKLDIAVVSVTSGTVAALLGNGSGGFGTPISYGVGTSPLSVAIADLNNDNKPDLVVANQNSNSVSVLLGNGDGTFATSMNVAAGENPQAAAVGDWNGDGKMDLAVANSTSGNVSILLGNGAGSFASADSLIVAQRPSSVTAADLNGDGKLDLVVPNFEDQFANGAIAVFFGNGAGAFSAPTQYTVEATPINVAAGDFNGDARLDLAVANVRSNSTSILFNTCSAGPPTAAVQFNAPTFSVDEGAEIATITVTRSGSKLSSVTVDYATVDGNMFVPCTIFNGQAQQNCDYLTAEASLSFAAGETSKSFIILLIDDAYLEGPESVNLILKNPEGANLGSQSTSTLTILDNDSSQSTVNPIDDARSFVRQHYYDFLNRLPDQGGLDYWTSQITSCGNDAACVHRRRIDVSAAYFVELEFQRTGYVVYRLYRAAHGTMPNTATRANVSYAQFNSDRGQLLEGAGLGQSTINLANAFVERPEFLQAYPNNLTNAQFVNQLFDTAQLAPYTTERQQQIDAMNNGSKTRAQVLLDVIETAEFKTREYNPAFVLMQYFGYLRRDPDQGGYDFSLNVLDNRVPNNFRAMVCAFLTSAEYQQRFGAAITRTNQDCSQ